MILSFSTNGAVTGMNLVSFEIRPVITSAEAAARSR